VENCRDAVTAEGMAARSSRSMS